MTGRNALKTKQNATAKHSVKAKAKLPAASKTSSQSTTTLRDDLSSTTTASTSSPNTAGTSLSESPSPKDRSNVELKTVRQLLNDAMATTPKRKKRKQATRVDDGGDDESHDQEANKKTSESGEAELTPAQAAQQRKLDRLIRWNCFLFFTNKLWTLIAKECYGSEFDIDSDNGQVVRLRISDSVKSWKHVTIGRMEDHVRDIFEDPEHAGLKALYTSRPLLMPFFSKLFTVNNFFGVWRYMDGYVSYEDSTELGQYFMKSIYINLAIEVKLYQDASTGNGKLDARERLIKFYDQLPLHPDFRDVDKNDFKELRDRYRNSKAASGDRYAGILEECYTSVGPPPAKKQQAVDLRDVVDGSDDSSQDDPDQDNANQDVDGGSSIE